jgi:hypothetical protein
MPQKLVRSGRKGEGFFARLIGSSLVVIAVGRSVGMEAQVEVPPAAIASS